MLGSAYIKNKELNLRFLWLATSDIEMVSYELGQPLTGFVGTPNEIFEQMFGLLGNMFLSCLANHEDYDSIQDSFYPFLKVALEKNLYLYYYMDGFVTFMLHGLVNPQKAIDELNSYLLDDCEVSIDSKHPAALCVFGQGLLLDDIKTRQQMLNDDLDVISGYNKEFEQFTPTQKLFLLAAEGRNYLTGEFKTSLLPDYAFDEDIDVKGIKECLIANKVEVFEMTDIDTMSDLIRYELYNTIKEQLVFKRCSYCNGYFVPSGRSDTEYCGRIKPGETKRCNEIAAFRKRAELVRTNPIHFAHNKAIKRMNKRKNDGSLSEKKYQDWSWQAIDKRDKCLNNELSLAEYQTWLDKSRLNKKNE